MTDAARANQTGPQVTKLDPRWDPVVYPDLDACIPPRELWPGPADPVTHFIRWPWEYLAYLTLIAGLRRDSRVLELGCNHGRTMLGLLGYLESPGRYDGLDILERQIQFAHEHVRPAHFQAEFTLADVYNGLYHPEGREKASEYRFPYPNDHFDVAFAASVFTHLLPDDARNYLRQTRRVLAPGGRALYSFFVLDHYRGAGTAACDLYEFAHELPDYPGVAVHRADRPEACIAYGLDAIESMAREEGLSLARVVPGYWSDPPDFAVNEQDLVLFTRE